MIILTNDVFHSFRFRRARAVPPADVCPPNSPVPVSPVGDVPSAPDGQHGFHFSGKYFPAPYLFEGADYTEEAELFGAVPCFDRDILVTDLLIDRYVSDGWLPGPVPVELISTWCWRFQFACRDADVFISSRCRREVARGKFARAAMDGFHRLKTFTRIHPSQSTIFIYRTAGEEAYLDQLNNIPETTLTA